MQQKGMKSILSLSIIVASCGTIWLSSFSPDALFGVFFRNYIGASFTQLGILFGLIQATSIVNLLSIFIFKKLVNRKLAFTLFFLAHRLLGLVPAIVAFYSDSIPLEASIRLVFISMGISWAFMNIGNVGYASWEADMLPESNRIKFFMRRSAVVNIVNVCWLFAVPTLIDIFPNPLITYGIFFGISTTLGVISLVCMLFLPKIPNVNSSEDKSVKVFSEPLRNKEFIRFSLAVGFIILSFTIFNPFIMPYLTSEDGINMPLTWMGIYTFIMMILWTVVIPFWGTLMERFGRKPVVMICALFPFSWLGYFFITSVNYVFIIPVIAALAGILQPGFWEGTFQMMLTLAPVKNRVSYIAWYMVITSGVSSIGPLLGGVLGDLLQDFHIPFGRGFAVEGFHLIMVLSLLCITLTLLLFRRVNEGNVKSFGMVFFNIVRPRFFRTVASMTTIVRSTSPVKVTKALRTIANKNDSIAFNDIIQRLEDPDQDIREEAIRALGRIGTAEAVDVLINRFNDVEATEIILTARSLGETGDPRAVPHLIDRLSSTSEDLQNACIRALGKIPSVDSFDPLLQLIKNGRSERIAVTGAEAATRLGFLEAAWEVFPRMHNTLNPILRRQLFIAMGNLAGKPGEFYQYIAGGVEEQKSKIDKLFRLAFQSAMLISGKKNTKISTGLKEVFSLYRKESFSDALDKLIAIEMEITGVIVGTFDDPSMVVEKGFQKNRRMGLWVWFLTEIDKIKTDLDPGIAGYEVLLLSYFLSSYMLVRTDSKQAR